MNAFEYRSETDAQFRPNSGAFPCKANAGNRPHLKSLPMAASSSKASDVSDDSMEIMFEMELFENQRWNPVTGWGSGLLFTDRWAWSDASGKAMDRQQITLPKEYFWLDSWTVQCHAGASKARDSRDSASDPSLQQGWRYATAFPSVVTPLSGADRAGTGHFVRWRRWTRTAARKRRRTASATPSAVGTDDKVSFRVATPTEAARAAFEHFRTELDVPEYACCPIHYELLDDPVVAASGRTYEKRVIEAIAESDGHDPFTREDLRGSALVPDLAMRRIVRAWAVYLEKGDGSALFLPDIDPVAAGTLERRRSAEELDAATRDSVEGYWQCSNCSFLNTGLLPACEVCAFGRGDAPALSPREAFVIMSGGVVRPIHEWKAAARVKAASFARDAQADAATSGTPAALEGGRDADDAKTATSPPAFATAAPPTVVTVSSPHTTSILAGGSCPDWLCCPVSKRLFVDPVILPSGHSFDKASLTVTVPRAAHGSAASGRAVGCSTRVPFVVDPVTGGSVPVTNVIPHRALLEACEDWSQRLDEWRELASDRVGDAKASRRGGSGMGCKMAAAAGIARDAAGERDAKSTAPAETSQAREDTMLEEAEMDGWVVL